MSMITLRSQNREIARYELNNRQLIRIGRLPDNDIVIDNMAVSGHHAQIVADEMGFIIKDVGSRNGTFIDGKPIESRRFADGDIVTIGKHELIFSDREQPSHDTTQLLEQDTDLSALDLNAGKLTVCLETTQQKEMIDQYNRSGHKTPLLEVKYRDKTLYKYLLKYKTTSIGRGSGNKIVIDNTAVSLEHAVITVDNSGFTISDLNSKNGTFVNKKPIKTCKLHNGDTITIGKHEIVFEQAGTYTYDEIGQPFVDDQSLNSSTETSYLSTKEYQAMLANGRSQDNALEKKAKPGFTFLKGGKGYAPIEKKVFQIGKSKTSDIVVKGLMTGDTAVLVTLKTNDYYLKYQGGFSKPVVNGQKIQESIKLNNGDVIEIGSVKLEFNV